MSVDREAAVTAIAVAIPDPPDASSDVTGARVAAWLRDGAPRADLDALCRQIDVRRKVAAAYDAAWARRDPEQLVDAATMAGVVAVLLRTAAADPLAADGWSLKAVNSALKALELVDVGVTGPALRGWAVELLDARTRSDR
jgi:hypothetical protein